MEFYNYGPYLTLKAAGGGVDVALHRKLQTHMEQYIYGSCFILKASGGEDGPRFAEKVSRGIVQLWTSFRTESRSDFRL